MASANCWSPDWAPTLKGSDVHSCGGERRDCPSLVGDAGVRNCPHRGIYKLATSIYPTKRDQTRDVSIGGTPYSSRGPAHRGEEASRPRGGAKSGHPLRAVVQTRNFLLLPGVGEPGLKFYAEAGMNGIKCDGGHQEHSLEWLRTMWYSSVGAEPCRTYSKEGAGGFPCC